MAADPKRGYLSSGQPRTIQIGDPTWTLLRQYADRSGILGAFGPFDTKDEAEAAIPELERIGLDSAMWEIVPTWRVQGAGAAS